MKFRGMEVNRTMAIWLGLHALIIVDIVLITIAMVFPVPQDIAVDIMIFDFCVCIILLVEWLMNFYMSTPKILFLKQKENWLSLIASIPFDVILPAVIPGISLLRYLRLLKLLRILVLFNRFVDGFEKFIKKSNIDKIMIGVFFIIIIFTALLWIYGPSYNLFDDFYFVIVTLTTVGYGDVTPQTFNEKVIAIALIIIGIFIFSTITASISSYLIDKLSEEEDDEIEAKLDEIQDNLDDLHKENQDLKREIKELKDLIKKDK
ncbi:ion transporter [Methanobrevibacter sp.]|uniref:potassium channel family protein n=1 Tax=Methanobrevibacter sp. TaxID=66852 RepID=UPI003865F070